MADSSEHTPSSERGPAKSLADLLDDARARLIQCPQEHLGAWHQPRRLLGIPRAARVRPAGVAWNLGVLLLTDDALYATGEVVRAREPARRGYTAESQRVRAAAAEAAYRGGFAEGQAVHVAWRMLDLDALARGERVAPLVLSPGVTVERDMPLAANAVNVQWSKGGMARPVSAYIDERVSLLCEPPPSSTSRVE